MSKEHDARMNAIVSVAYRKYVKIVHACSEV